MYDSSWYLQNYELGGLMLVYQVPTTAPYVVFTWGSSPKTNTKYSRFLTESEQNYIAGLPRRVLYVMHWRNDVWWLKDKTVDLLEERVRRILKQNFNKEQIDCFSLYRLPKEPGELGIVAAHVNNEPATNVSGYIPRNCWLEFTIQETIRRFGLKEVV